MLCFGELLLRLSPEPGWIKKSMMPVYLGGAELNTATALSKWGIHVAYCSALPKTYLSKEICCNLKEKNIDISHVILKGDRIGTYYLQQGSDLKREGVIYDRTNSSFSEIKKGQIDWDILLADVTWFHLSAISPALNENVSAVCKEALEAASTKGITISLDLNYRNKLWQYGKHPKKVMPALVEHCDIIMGNIWAANILLDIALDEDVLMNNRAGYIIHARKTSESLMKKFPKCKAVANTFRFDNDGHINYYATLDTGRKQFVSSEFSTNKAVDKVGSGDCFMAGLIYGNVMQNSPQQIVDFATAAAFNKLSITGDATTSTVEEIKSTY